MHFQVHRFKSTKNNGCACTHWHSIQVAISYCENHSIHHYFIVYKKAADAVTSVKGHLCRMMISKLTPPSQTLFDSQIITEKTLCTIIFQFPVCSIDSVGVGIWQHGQYLQCPYGIYCFHAMTSFIV